jgi:hypothetical protein
MLATAPPEEDADPKLLHLNYCKGAVNAQQSAASNQHSGRGSGDRVICEQLDNFSDGPMPDDPMTRFLG